MFAQRCHSSSIHRGASAGPRIGLHHAGRGPERREGHRQRRRRAGQRPHVPSDGPIANARCAGHRARGHHFRLWRRPRRIAGARFQDAGTHPRQQRRRAAAARREPGKLDSRSRDLQIRNWHRFRDTSGCTNRRPGRRFSLQLHVHHQRPRAGAGRRKAPGPCQAALHRHRRPAQQLRAPRSQPLQRGAEGLPDQPGRAAVRGHSSRGSVVPPIAQR